MIREAEQHATEDKRRRELIEARNQADALIYSTERSLQENGSRLNDADRRVIEEAINSLRTTIAGEDVAQIRQGMEALTRAAMRIGEAVNQGQTQNAGGSTPGSEGVVDAEFEDVDDRKRGAS
jgi:molecular chaperone DnaK